MRAPEIVLYVLFPMLIAVGLALGMDAVSATEFWYARAAFNLAAAIAIGLTMWWFYQADFTAMIALMVFFTVGSIGATWWGGQKWLDLKENTYCYFLVAFNSVGAPANEGPYPLMAFSSGPYPVTNVRVAIRNVQHDANWPINGPNYIEIGDVEPAVAKSLPQIPPLAPGVYQIEIRARSGIFREILAIKWDGKNSSQKIEVDRRIMIGGQKPALIPLRIDPD